MLKDRYGCGHARCQITTELRTQRIMVRVSAFAPMSQCCTKLRRFGIAARLALRRAFLAVPTVGLTFELQAVAAELFLMMPGRFRTLPQ